MLLLYTLILSSLTIRLIQGQLQSPCPEVFKYEPRKDNELDRWHADLALSTHEDLEGVWLKIVLNRRAETVGVKYSQWLTEVASPDNKEFILRNPEYRLEAGPAVIIKFFVKFNPAYYTPIVKKILLNGKQICPVRPIGHTDDDIDDEIFESPAPPSSGTGLSFDSSIRNNPTTMRPYLSTSVRYDSGDSSDFVSNDERDVDRPGLSVSSNSKDDGQFFNGDFNVASKTKPASRAVAVLKQPVHCGTVAERPSPLISQGQQTTPGQWPWHAALYRLKGTELIYTCGGTLISERYIVTPAHCVAMPRTNISVNKSLLIVYLGKYNLINFSHEVQDKEVEEIIIHPDYNNTVYYNDIAVLKLTTPAEYNKYIRPVCLWEEKSTNVEDLVGRQGTVVGWGFNENKQLTRNLMQAQMPIVSTRSCLFSNRNFFSQFIFDKNFCAGFKNGTSVCNGDSGGGMVIPKYSPKGENSVWQLRGIVSVGVALQGEGVCDPNQYTVFTDVGKYVDWIKNITSL